VVGHKISVVTEPITRTLDLNDDGVVKQPIEECGGTTGSPKTSLHSAKPRFEVRQSVDCTPWASYKALQNNPLYALFTLANHGLNLYVF
jgi:hypothetical protein